MINHDQLDNHSHLLNLPTPLPLILTAFVALANWSSFTHSPSMCSSQGSISDPLLFSLSTTISALNFFTKFYSHCPTLWWSVCTCLSHCHLKLNKSKLQAQMCVPHQLANISYLFLSVQSLIKSLFFFLSPTKWVSLAIFLNLSRFPNAHVLNTNFSSLRIKTSVISDYSSPSPHYIFLSYPVQNKVLRDISLVLFLLNSNSHYLRPRWFS